MNPKIYETLEFSKILERLSHCAQTEIGRRQLLKCEPAADYDRVQQWQEETSQSLSILSQDKNIPIPSLKDLNETLKRLQLEASLNGRELAELGKLLSTTHQVDQFFANLAEEDKHYPALTYWSNQLISLPDQVRMIFNAVDEEGAVLSTASTQLASIRRQQSNTEQQIRQQLNDMLKSYARHLSDSLITMRNNRYVLPVKAEFQSSIPGTAHDQSSTGQTIYIEPQAVVRLNNRRSELQVEERVEIERILEALSLDLAPYVNEIMNNQRVISCLDMIQARGEYARLTDATQPKFSRDRIVALFQARHPLIDPEEIVANDILIGGEYQALIITGPNTGGKTILLKTLGLLQLMGQAGLHIPAAAGSTLGLFDEVYADIGDEQSIEQSLSTFSSHMTNIVRILDEATAQSLLLFDELGSGTDPQEGASLAMAILDYIRRLGATVMATTHYPELKVYAHEAPSTINASMEFDSESLSPTYRLLIGIPGRSNALEISQRLGLKPEILTVAREGISQDSQSMNEMVARLERERREAERAHQEAEETLAAASQLHQDLRTEYDRWLAKKHDLVEQGKREANEKVAEIQAQAEEILQEIRDLQLEQGSDRTIQEHVLIDKKGAFDQLKQPEHLRKNKVLKREKAKNTFKVGNDVEVLTYGQRGTIVDQKSPKEFVVQMGILKMAIPAEELRPLDKVEPKRQVNVQRQAGSKVKPELDLRGQRYEAAMRQLSQYLDSALLSNHPLVTIIHGKGTGAIRQGVHKLLDQHPQVDHYEFAPPNAGGNGATLVYFK